MTGFAVGGGLEQGRGPSPQCLGELSVVTLASHAGEHCSCSVCVGQAKNKHKGTGLLIAGVSLLLVMLS